MKISYNHLINFLDQNPSIEEVSSKLFQLGHEHEIINNNIFDIEFTPNRGDCLSLYGLARDLNAFYDVNFKKPSLTQDLPKLNLKYSNKTLSYKTDISFLNIKIKNGNINKYEDYLNKYFIDLGVKKNNFFTDISNYLAYEIGQPTHCYDITKLNLKEGIVLENASENESNFTTLFNEEIEINSNDLVFKNNSEIINIAGVIGGKNTSCSVDTLNVLIECAYFKPESIIGRSQKYNVQSDAAYKFERGVDPSSHDFALSRFIEIVKDHAEIETISIFTDTNQEQKKLELDFDIKKINKILGFNIHENEYRQILHRLGFDVHTSIIIPSYRNDISHQNDLAEEVARVIGYDNISRKNLTLPEISQITEDKIHEDENKIKHFLINHGFNEVINNPFTSKYNKSSIAVDNPLDKNRKYLRYNLMDSLIENLQYNENRQNDSVKIFEISDVYYLCKENNEVLQNRKLAIIISGRVGLNHQDFSKKLDVNYLNEIFSDIDADIDGCIVNVDRNKINSKIKSPIYALEIPIEFICNKLESYPYKLEPISEFIQYKKISEFPSSTRDISFSTNDETDVNEIFNILNKVNHKLLSIIYI